MNYIYQLNAFHELLGVRPLSTGQIALWFALMDVNNKCAWIEWFTVSNNVLEVKTGGLCRKGIYHARNALKQAGLIDFKSNGTKATSYKITKLYETCTTTQATTQATTQGTATLNKQNKTKQNKDIYIPDFEKFWKAYPKKVGKQNAIKIFQKIDPMSEELFEKIIAEVEWQKKFGSMQDKQYCKDPERWLRDKRWEDERIERNAFQNGNSSQQPKGEEDNREWLYPPPKQA